MATKLRPLYLAKFSALQMNLYLTRMGGVKNKNSEEWSRDVAKTFLCVYEILCALKTICKSQNYKGLQQKFPYISFHL